MSYKGIFDIRGPTPPPYILSKHWYFWICIPWGSRQLRYTAQSSGYNFSRHFSSHLRPSHFFIPQISQDTGRCVEEESETGSPISSLGCLVNKPSFGCKLWYLCIWLAVNWTNDPASVTPSCKLLECFWGIPSWFIPYLFMALYRYLGGCSE